MKLPSFITTDEHFLSACNPLATAKQREAEALAIEVMAMPAFAQGRKAAEHRWRSLVGSDPGAEAWSRFDAFMDESAFGNVLKAVNGDPNYPRLVRLVMPPHEWFGMHVPGSRFGAGPGIDQSYAIAPVDYGARYELTGQWIDPAPADHIWNLVGNPSLTNVMAQLEHSQLEVGPDGTFTVTVDPEPADGRPNHLQTKPGAQYLFIRDCRSNWRQAATALRIRRLDAPSRLQWTRDQLTERAAQLMLEDAPAMYVWMRYFSNLEVNTVTEPFGTGTLGGLVSQTISFARLSLADDQAFVITVDPAEALFHNIQLNDWWFAAIGDYVSRTSALNNAQSARCVDGTLVYVVSLRDPGVHNWLDPAGLHELTLVHRWQRLPVADGKRKPAIRGRLVKFDELDKILERDVPRVDATERAKQLEERLASYRLRLVDA